GGRRHTRFSRDWNSDVCSSDLALGEPDAGYERGFQLLECHVEFPTADGGQDAGPGAELARLADATDVDAGAAPQAGRATGGGEQIGRAAWRERVEVSVVGG